MKYRFWVFSALFLLAACEQPLSPEQQAQLEKTARREITCIAGDECSEKWGKALAWVKQHAGDSEPVVSGNEIKASTSAGNTGWSYSITKKAESRSVYKIALSLACGGSFSCHPRELELKADFVEAVLGKPAELSQGIGQLQGGITAIIGKCEKKRLNGVLRNHEEAAECSNPGIIKLFRQAGYPYMDLAREYTMKRMKYAKMVDARKMDEEEMLSKMDAVVSEITHKEQARSGSGNSGGA